MEIAALVLSIVAIIISVVVAVMEYSRDYKIAWINIEVEFYKEIYKDYLISVIPYARKLMWIDQEHYLKDSEELVNALTEMQHDSLYFYYHNKPFYNKLKTKLQSLEDYLITTQDEKLIAQDQAMFWERVEKELDDIYSVISEAYRGK